MPKPISFKIRRMNAKDLDQVLAIERAAFEQPYSREILAQELRIDSAHVHVATWRKKIVGYIDFWMVLDEVELVSVAVHPDFKKHGIGRGLMDCMIQFAETRGARFISLDVRTSNFAAQALYEKFGFKKVGRRKAYYSDNEEDAIIMKKEWELL